jgi:hypothetical protein
MIIFNMIIILHDRLYPEHSYSIFNMINIYVNNIALIIYFVIITKIL